MGFGLGNTKVRKPRGLSIKSGDTMGVTGVPAPPSVEHDMLQSRARGDLSDIHRAAEVMGDSERMGHVRNLVSQHQAVNSAILGKAGLTGLAGGPRAPKGKPRGSRGPKLSSPRSLKGGRI